jgi:hypothetical protein
MESILLMHHLTTCHLHHLIIWSETDHRIRRRSSPYTVAHENLLLTSLVFSIVSSHSTACDQEISAMVALVVPMLGCVIHANFLAPVTELSYRIMSFATILGIMGKMKYFLR